MQRSMLSAWDNKPYYNIVRFFCKIINWLVNRMVYTNQRMNILCEFPKHHEFYYIQIFHQIKVNIIIEYQKWWVSNFELQSK